ncbi:hypothetical protein [Haladaptatus sp. CMSO5]|uniref:hypothetical protein n=1 Tax=Haladaptatus sp. CMSO5 TaxID=3120514 RepID=UPI002FCE078D
MRNSRTPLSPREQDAFEQLEAYVETGGNEVVTRAVAVDYLTTTRFERADARDLLEQLLLKGYLYEVDDELHTLLRS